MIEAVPVDLPFLAEHAPRLGRATAQAEVQGNEIEGRADPAIAVITCSHRTANDNHSQSTASSIIDGLSDSG